MNEVLLANVVSLVGCVLMVGIGFLQSKRSILLGQCVQFVFLGCSHLLLGAMTGLIACVIGIARNLVFLRREESPVLKSGFVLGQVALSLFVGIGGLIDWFPVVANVLYTWFIDTKSEVRLKLVMITAQVMWLVYDFCYMNYVAFAFDGLTILSNAIGILMLLWKTRKQ